MLNEKYRRTNAFCNQFIDICKLNIIPKDAKFDIINLGSNHPKFGLDYSESGIRGMNIAVGPETFKYDFIVLKKFSRNLHPDSNVIIPICLLNFFLFDFKSKNEYIKYYDLLLKKEMPDYNYKQYIKDYKFPLFFHPQKLKSILRDRDKDNRMMLDSNPMTKEQIAEDATFWIKDCWDKEFGIDIQDMKPLSGENKDSIEKNIQILSDMITYCIENEFKPVITILPTTIALRNKFSDEFIKRYIIDNIYRAIDGRQVLFLNYMDEAILQKDEYYINSFFMNRTGAKIMGKKIVENINMCITKSI